MLTHSVQTKVFKKDLNLCRRECLRKMKLFKKRKEELSFTLAKHCSKKSSLQN